MGQEAVAIVGAAFALPGADDFDTLHGILRSGRSRLGAPGPDRVRHAGGDPGTAYLPGGYLDRIDLFDHDFFGVPPREAELMDPHQRMTLHLVHRAIEDAGRAPRSLRGTRTAVILSAPRPEYATLIEEADPQRILGTLPAALAARVAYLLDLSGPALVVDTACSGSLAALALAVEQLRGGGAELAIAGGISLQVLLQPRAGHEPLLGVESPDGTCRPFDADADGTAGGEGGGFVLLRPLGAAVADGDHIHAVLRGVAVNHNGYRATSMSAPSHEAQAGLIAEAWHGTGGSVASAGYLECHGSATPLGDLTEVTGVRRAVEAAGGAPAALPIGGAKGTMGHLDHAAGMAGLFRVLSALRQTTLYPTAGFRTPHALLAPGGPVRVDTEARPWPAPADGTPRRAGLSSYGLTGTNVHVVIEEAPAPAPVPDPPRPAGELITVSGATPEALGSALRGLADFLDTTDHDLATVAHVLTRGRDHHPWRRAFAARSHAALADALRTATVPERPATAPRPVVLLLSGDGDVAQSDDTAWRALRGDHPALADTEDRLAPGGPGAEDRPGTAATLLIRQLALHDLVRSLGLDTGRLVGSGPGNLAVAVVRGRTTAARALHDATGTALTADVDEDGLRRAVKDFIRDDALLVELGRDGVLSRRIRALAPELTVLPLLGPDGVPAALARLYEAGADLDWERHHAGRRLGRAALPTYPFAPVPCWYRPPERHRPRPDQGNPAAPGPVRAAVAGPTRSPGQGLAPPAQEPPPTRDEAGLRQQVTDLWSRILKVPGIGPDADYFALGGTSIAGITLLRESTARFGVRLTFADLYEHRTVRALAAVIARRASGDAARAEAFTPLPPLPSGERVPLSYNQEQLWYLDRLAPLGPLYNIPGDLRHHGDLDHDALRAALRDVVGRHTVLRTRIAEDLGRPHAVLDAPVPEPRTVDLSGHPDPGEAARRLVEEESRVPFDLATGPLLRTTLLRLGEREHLLLCTWHHIVFDGWSPTVFFRDLAEYYDARRTGRPAVLPGLPAGYAEFAAWQRSWLDPERMEHGLRYWRDRLAGLEPAELPLDRPRPEAVSHAGDLLEFSLSDAVDRGLREFSRAEGVTPFVTLLAVVNVLLHRWAGHEDVVVGAATSGRYHPDTHDMVGYFNNVLPFRTRVEGGLTFREVVRRTAQTVTGVLDHEEIPFGKIVADLAPRRDPSRHPLFTVCYTHQNTARHLPDSSGLELVPGGVNFGGIAPGTAKVDLTIGLNDEPDGPMIGYLEYAVALFDRSSMERLATLFQELAAEVVATPDRPLRHGGTGRADAPRTAVGAASEPVRAAPPGRSAVLRGPVRALPAEPVPAVVARRAAEDPDRAAVVDLATGRTHSYGEVEALAACLARRLVAAGVTPGTPVPVVVPRGVELVAGWLGVLKAGAVLVPVDPALPPARVADLLSRVAHPLVVTGPGVRLPTPATRTVPAVADGPASAGASRPPSPAAPQPPSPLDPRPLDPRPQEPAAVSPLAYIAHTSGSTGTPHGCEIGHASLLNLLAWYGELTGLAPGDRVAQLCAPGFDGALLETFGTLYHGATLHILHDTLRTPADLLGLLDREGITVAMMPTPLAELVLGSGLDAPGLRVLATGGEKLRIRPAGGVSYRVLNLYGPTECTVVSTWAEVPPGSSPQPPSIGRPVHNTSAYVLRPDGAPCTTGEEGELYVGGVAVGRGYHRLAALTAQRFVPDPFAGAGALMYRTGDLARLSADGSLEFLGRADRQTEIRGHRVEPAETERALLDHPAVHEAAVLPGTAPSGAPGLVAHVAGERLPAAAELIAWVAERLPTPLVPGRIVPYERLPRTPNGKTDQTRMVEMTETVRTPGPTLQGGAVDAAAAERVLSRIWSELLGHATVAPDDDFFAIGGDSVLSVAVAARAEAAGLTLTPHDVLRLPTVRGLAAHAVRVPERPTAAGAPSAPPPSGPLPLTPLMHALLEHAEDGARDFVVAEVLEVAAGIRSDTVRTALAHLVAVHEPLRYRVRHNSVGRRIEVAAVPPQDILDVTVLPALDEEATLAVLAADKEALGKDIDPARGAMLRVRFYDRGPARTGLLLLIVHHFAYDHTSAVPLVEDLNAGLRGTAGGTAADPGRRAWGEWSRHLAAMATSDELAAEATYWTAVLAEGAAAPGPPDHPEALTSGRGRQGLVVRTVPEGRVAPALLGGGTPSREAATAAVACAWSRWLGGSAAYLLTVGEATTNVFRPHGRARSFGWFSNAFPVVLPVGGARADEALPEVAERLRAVPHDGVGYGILRHLSDRTPAVERLRALPEPRVLVEHTSTGGEPLRLGDGPAWIRSEPLIVEQPSLLAYVPIVVASAIVDGELVIYLAHDDRLPGDRMEALADHLATAFAELAGER
ncbi:amino acid adenylation domain-containing protein [Streptomyces sp. NPDC057638]|uniref:amino acid adenylation domain-containing protein n=1 Tax=Streptomyces sp. NPDC057638 TaxID=3346190 RepID=UPI0036C0E5F0